MLTRLLRGRAPVAPPSRETYDYTRYETGYDDFRLWLDRLVDALPGHPVVAAVLCGAAVYAVGALLALPFGFLGVYVRTRPVYLGAIGFALVLGVANLAHRRAHVAYRNLRPVFTVDDAAFKERMTRFFGLLKHRGGTIVASGAVFLACVGVLCAVFLVTAHARRHLHLGSLRPRSFPHEWFAAAHRAPALVILGWYSLAVAAALGTSARMLIVNLRFLMSLRQLPVIPMPTIVRARLRPATNLYVIVSVGWTFGIVLFAILYYRSYDAIAIGVLAALAVMGVATLATPQLEFKRYVDRSYDRLCAIALRWLLGGSGIDLREKADPEWATRLAPDNLAHLRSLTERPRTWIYEPQDIVFWVGAQVIGVGAFVAQQSLTKLLG